jgi:hypothetical protein
MSDQNLNPVILAKYFDRYAQLGMIYTTKKGKTEVLEVELAFKPGMSVGELTRFSHEKRVNNVEMYCKCMEWNYAKDWNHNQNDDSAGSGYRHRLGCGRRMEPRDS